MKKQLLFVLLSFCVFQSSNCQNFIGQTLTYNKIQFNPATAGMQDKFIIAGTAYWMRPLYVNTYDYQLSFEGNINKINSGVGVVYNYSHWGVASYKKFSALYNYKLVLNDISYLRFGGAVNLNFVTVDLIPIQQNMADNPYLEQEYPINQFSNTYK